MIKKINIDIFGGLFLQSQEEHRNTNEPIPSMNDKSLNTVKYILGIPFQSVFGNVLYWGFYKKASALFYFFIKNHPLENGNKRLASALLICFYQINDRNFKLSNNELIQLAENTSKSNALDSKQIIKEISEYLKSKK